MRNKTLAIMALVICLGLIGATSGTRYKSLNFENPGSKRLLETEAGKYFYFRSLPEKSITLSTTGISKLELRSFAIEKLAKPEIYTIIDKTRKAYALELDSTDGAYNIYKPLSIDIPAKTDKIEILCYSRSVYLRAFNVLPPKAPKPIKLKNLVLKAHGGALTMQHNGNSSEYFSMLPSSPLKFSLNNGRNAVVYVRPRLLDRSIPKLGVFHNGSLVDTIEFSIKRTTKYQVQGIKNLGIGIKIDLPQNHGSSDYELRPLSDHLFIGKPVLVKKK